MVKEFKFPFLLTFLNEQANMSTCTKYKVGVVLFGLTTGHVYGTGRNGTPSGVVHCNEITQLLNQIKYKADTVSDIADIVYESDVYAKYVKYPKLILENTSFKTELKDLFPEYSWKYIHNLLKTFAAKRELLLLDDNDIFQQVNCLLNKYSEITGLNEVQVAEAITLTDTLTFNQKIFELQISLLEKTFHKDDIANLKYNYVHSKLELHAERNMLNHLNQSLLDTIQEPLGLLITHTPCFECFKDIYYKLKDKLKVVYYQNVYYHSPYLAMYGQELKEFTHTIDLLESINVKTIKI